MYYYPCELPKQINKKKIERYKKYSNKVTTLYSPEGIFQIKGHRLMQTHFKDDHKAFQTDINNIAFICDNSEMKNTQVNKIPFEFEMHSRMVTCYEKGSLQMFVEEDETQKDIENLYFIIKQSSIFGIEKEMTDLLSLASSKK